MIVLQVNVIQQTVFVKHTAASQVREEPAKFKAGKQFPLCKSHNGSKPAISVAGRVQSTAAAQVFHRIKNLILLAFAVIIAIRIEFHLAVFVHNHMFLLHQQHIGRAKAGDAVESIRSLRAANYSPEQGRNLIKKRMVDTIAFTESLDGLIIEESEQRLCCDNIFAAADQIQDVFVVRRLSRAFCVQLLQKTFVPFPDG